VGDGDSEPLPEGHLAAAPSKSARVVHGKAIANAVLFQIGWLVCLLGGSTAALAFAAPYLWLHFAWVSDNPREWRFVVGAGVLGIALDAVALRCGVFGFVDGAIYPPWMAVLWLLFATLVPHGLRWLQGRWLLAAALGAVGGTLSYVAGVRLGVARVDDLWRAAAWWSAQWAVLMPLLLAMANRNRAAAT